jgi:hypothetical protein
MDGGALVRFTVRYAGNCDDVARYERSERGWVGPGLRVRLQVEGYLGTGRALTERELDLPRRLRPADLGRVRALNPAVRARANR